MRLDGKITHGMVMDVESVGADNISFVFGPVGAYIDPSLYYTKEEIDAMLANLGAQSDWDENDTDSKAYIKNKPVLAAVATSGSYDDLDDQPTIPTVPTNVSAFTNDAGYLTQHQSIKTVNNESMVGSGNLNLVPTDVFNNFCPIIEDTRSSVVAAITGVAPFSSLVDGQRIVLKVNKAIPNSPTITLTLSGGNDTSAIPAYSAYQDTVTTVWGNAIKTGMYVELIYESANNRWMMVGNRDSNTTYPNMTQVNIGAGTSTSANVISPKLLHDNAYIVEESYSSGSLKANKMYDFGTVSSALTIPTLDATNDLVSNALNFYALRFIAGADNLSITFPAGVIVDDEPTINTGDYVEIMINLYVENNTNHFYASIKVWQKQ